ncbi:hypothetical protein [Nocardioides kribbensis]|uniref:hypothetical protein n=1 Tax=Nocardioides kribbensis TaxID=305517 RepID=UPI0018795260|nr:hypothetical protein [Nocardioides kribbensis]
MYGDTDVMRRRVLQLREQGGDIRALADRLVARTEAVGWSGRAAETMRERVRERAGHLRDAAADHDAAADSLERHAQEVGLLQETIGERERRAATLVADARARVAAVQAHADDDAALGVRRLADPADEQVAGFDAPPAGHRDWLTVELPGL